MRISDWSSDVCSSDVVMLDLTEVGGRDTERRGELGLLEAALVAQRAKAGTGEDALAGQWREPFDPVRSTRTADGCHSLQNETSQLCKFTFACAVRNGQGRGLPS